MDASADFMLKGKKIVSMKSICPVMKTFVLAALTLQNIFLNRILNCSMQNKVYFLQFLLFFAFMFLNYSTLIKFYIIALVRDQLLIVVGK